MRFLLLLVVLVVLVSSGDAAMKKRKKFEGDFEFAEDSVSLLVFKECLSAFVLFCPHKVVACSLIEFYLIAKLFSPFLLLTHFQSFSVMTINFMISNFLYFIIISWPYI